MSGLPLPDFLARNLAVRFAVLFAGVSLLVLILGAIWLGLEVREAALSKEKERLGVLEDRLAATLSPLLQTGHPELIETWLQDIRDHDDVRTVRILRRDGEVAFRDLETLRRVNDYLGEEAFTRPPRPSLSSEVPEPDLQRALAGEAVFRLDSEAEVLGRLQPIPSGPDCQECHGYETADYRGILHVTASLERVEGEVWAAYRRNLALAGAAALLLGGLILILVRRQFIAPMRRLVEVTHRLASGDQAIRADTGRADELGTLARSLNRLADQLQEETGGSAI